MPTISIGTGSSLVVGNNPSRVSVLFRNDSSNDIYLGVSSSVTTSQYEYHLKPGDSVNFNEIEDGDASQSSFYAIASASSSLLSVFEGNTRLQADG